MKLPEANGNKDKLCFSFFTATYKRVGWGAWGFGSIGKKIRLHFIKMLVLAT